VPTVLLTQCLQRDFVDPLRPGDPLPNKLHVGAEEARRLLGDDPAHSPLAQLLAWAREAPGLDVVHIRDWHDPDDAAQRVHLATFGPHCVRDTPGARFVIEAPPGAREHIVDAIGLNDYADTRLPEVLAALAATGPLRIGVIGVWTEAKVSYLLYDLATRLPAGALADGGLATCSALTASSSRSRHFHALDQLERLLNVRVFHDVAGFADWLSPGANPPPPPPRGGTRATVDAELPEADRALVESLFRDSAKVQRRLQEEAARRMPAADEEAQAVARATRDASVAARLAAMSAVLRASDSLAALAAPVRRPCPRPSSSRIVCGGRKAASPAATTQKSKKPESIRRPRAQRLA
jgi:nicotinamidase-related amidase